MLMDVLVMEVEEWPVPPTIYLFIYTPALNTESFPSRLTLCDEVLVDQLTVIETVLHPVCTVLFRQQHCETQCLRFFTHLRMF